mmetsp:Transcript_2746/g.8045  ORF Transcript_2746/g.8045 Transcript_2746/m.8045 type:complete len:200 (-) Transcript_2746:2642-3241(-)
MLRGEGRLYNRLLSVRAKSLFRRRKRRRRLRRHRGADLARARRAPGGDGRRWRGVLLGAGRRAVDIHDAHLGLRRRPRRPGDDAAGAAGGQSRVPHAGCDAAGGGERVAAGIVRQDSRKDIVCTARLRPAVHGGVAGARCRRDGRRRGRRRALGGWSGRRACGGGIAPRPARGRGLGGGVLRRRRGVGRGGRRGVCFRV